MAVSTIDPNGLNIGQIGGTRNLIINGAMQVAQRGTSFTVSSTSAFWGVDRFAFQTNANTNSTIAQVVDAPVGLKYSLKLTNGTAYTPATTDFGRIYTRLEGYSVDHLNLGTANSESLTLSFWVKSSVTGSFGAMIGGNGNGIYVWSYSISQANTWEYKSLTVPAGTITTYGGSTTNGQGFQIAWDMGEGPDRSNSAGWHSDQPESEMGLSGGAKIVSTAGATWQITGVQLEAGDTATPFEHRSYGQELALCERYFVKLGGTSNYAVGAGAVWTTSFMYVPFKLPSQMRAAPTLSASDVSNTFIYQGGSTFACTTVGVAGANNPDVAEIEFQSATSGLSANGGAWVRLASNAKILLDAEL